PEGEANYRLSATAELPAEPMAVFVERIVGGARYPAATAEIVLDIAGQRLRVPPVKDGCEGGWTWCYAGCIAPEGGPQPMELNVAGRWGQEEAHAAFSRVAFVAASDLAANPSAPVRAASEMQIDGETAVPFTAEPAPGVEQVDLLAAGPND